MENRALGLGEAGVRTVILGEPDLLSLAMVQSELTALGLEVLSCSTLEEVLGSLSRERPVCIISDRIPGGQNLTGVKAISATRTNERDYKVILLCDELTNEFVFEAYHCGADLVLLKPVSRKDWASILSRV